MAYSFKYILNELKNNLKIFENLLIGMEGTAIWKSSPEKWCLLEIVCHLYDEEREDFRARITHLFNSPTLPLPPIDPVGWVQSRKYLSQDYDLRLSQFFKERENSLRWLQEKVSTVIPASWDCVIRHPDIGEISAYGFLENWLGHDYLHIRQILQVKFDYWSHLSGNPLNYAKG